MTKTWFWQVLCRSISRLFWLVKGIFSVIFMKSDLLSLPVHFSLSTWIRFLSAPSLPLQLTLSRSAALKSIAILFIDTSTLTALSYVHTHTHTQILWITRNLTSAIKLMAYKYFSNEPNSVTVRTDRTDALRSRASSVITER